MRGRFACVVFNMLSEGVWKLRADVTYFLSESSRTLVVAPRAPTLCKDSSVYTAQCSF